MKPKQIKPMKKKGRTYLKLTDEDKANIYWDAIVLMFPRIKAILTDLINEVKPELLPLFIDGAPLFVRTIIIKRLQQGKGGLKCLKRGSLK
jgi:hypothetical protein